jgi:hypothetical protein
MEKVRFALDVEDGWPPIAIEGVWCERTGDLYELKNAPFFIKGLAFGDTFIAEPDPVNECIFEFQVVESSGNSLVWVMDNADLDFETSKKKLNELGCRVEGFPNYKLHAIDIPASVNTAAINILVDEVEQLGFAIAFPVWRHEHTDTQVHVPNATL